MNKESASIGLIRAAHIDAAGAVVVRTDVAVPLARDGHVVIRTLVSALCGSDLHRFRGAESYGIDTGVFGHETVGELSDGTGRVLALPFPSDGRVFAELQSVPESMLIPVPEELDPGTAVFAQQLGTVVFALRRFLRASGLPEGAVPDRVAVIGAGPAGLLFVKLLRLLGCSTVVVEEPVAHRRAIAEANGAMAVDPADRDVDDAGSTALTIDTSGDLAGRERCVALAANGGVIGIFGLPDDEPGAIGLDVLSLLGRNLTVVGAMGAQGEPGLRSFRDAMTMLADGRINVADLVSHVGALDDLPDLSRIAAHQTEPVVKVLIRFPENTDIPLEP